MVVQGGMASDISRLLRWTTAVLVALPVVSSLAYAASPQLKLARQPTRPGAPVTLRVFIASPAPVGAYTLQLAFDAAALELVDLGGGRAEFAAPPVSNPGSFPSGVVRFSAFQPVTMEGPIGLCQVATLTFKPRAVKGSTRVEVEAVIIADTLGSTYQAAKVHRTLRLRGR